MTEAEKISKATSIYAAIGENVVRQKQLSQQLDLLKAGYSELEKQIIQLSQAPTIVESSEEAGNE